MQQSSSKSRLAERLLRTSFVVTWLRRPSYEIAEAVIRLRRLRGMSQEQLAAKMGTKQPAIARLESGLTNVRMNTVVQLAEALDATIRVDIEPCELLRVEAPAPRWWDRTAALIVKASESETMTLELNRVFLPSSAHDQTDSLYLTTLQRSICAPAAQVDWVPPVIASANLNRLVALRPVAAEADE